MKKKIKICTLKTLRWIRKKQLRLRVINFLLSILSFMMTIVFSGRKRYSDIWSWTSVVLFVIFLIPYAVKGSNKVLRNVLFFVVSFFCSYLVLATSVFWIEVYNQSKTPTGSEGVKAIVIGIISLFLLCFFISYPINAIVEALKAIRKKGKGKEIMTTITSLLSICVAMTGIVLAVLNIFEKIKG